MSDSKIYISQSNIHGKGLFAKQDIEKDEVIGVVKGVPTKKMVTMFYGSRKTRE